MKTIIFSSIIVIFLLVGILLFTNSNVDSSSIKSTKTTYVVKVHVSGCDDCTSTTYCIDGGPSYNANSCAFTIYLDKGIHTICVHCPSNKSGNLSFMVNGDPIRSGYICDCKYSRFFIYMPGTKIIFFMMILSFDFH